MKTLALCLAFVLAPPGRGALFVAQIPPHAPATAGSTLLTLGLTAFLVLLSLYFYRISVALTQEAMRRERLARRFVERGSKPAPLPPVQDCDIEEVDSLLAPENLLEVS